MSAASCHPLCRNARTSGMFLKWRAWLQRSPDDSRGACIMGTQYRITKLRNVTFIRPLYLLSRHDRHAPGRLAIIVTWVLLSRISYHDEPISQQKAWERYSVVDPITSPLMDTVFSWESTHIIINLLASSDRFFLGMYPQHHRHLRLFRSFLLGKVTRYRRP